MDRFLNSPTVLNVDIGALDLDNGERLAHVVQHVARYGTPNADGSNVVLVPHALTGSAEVLAWWDGLVGPGKAIDTNRLCVLGVNTLGGCYGSTGPASPAADGKPYASRFPVITVPDMVRAQRRALAHLGINRLALVIGGSLGGMQALQWALESPHRVERAIVVGAYDSFSAMGIALDAVARQAIFDDPHFKGGDYYGGPAPEQGLRHARMIAMLTYKSEALFDERFGRRKDRKGGDPARALRDRFDIEGYLEYQGDIFVKRMDANSYLALSRAMDMFDTTQTHYERIETDLTFVGIASDWLFPAARVHRAAERFARLGNSSRYFEMTSGHGHDAFLADTDELGALLAPVLAPLYDQLLPVS